jgi:hypothetical protein
MNRSDNITDLAKALHRAQGKIKHAVKDSANPFFKSKYADLTSVWDAIRDAFQAEGLSVSQLPSISDQGTACLETILMHTTGQFIAGMCPLNPAKNDPQGVGSAITYMRRYALQAVAGVCADDDDGEAAHGRGTAKKQTSTGEPAKKKPVWSDEDKKKVGAIRAALMAFGDGGQEAADHIWKTHAYDEPAVVLVAMQTELNEWEKQ